VKALQIHLPDQQVIVFQNDADMARVVENAAIRNTMLTGFYDINRDYARREERGMEIDCQKDPRQYLYVEVPEHFTWDNVRYC